MRGRLVVLTIETTGGHVYDRHHHDEDHANRITELACVELVDGVITQRKFHVIFKNKKHPDAPVFAEAVDALFSFIGKAPVLYHGKAFVESFMNAELGWCHQPPLSQHGSKLIDTVHLSRLLDKFLGKEHCSHSLDALAVRYGLLDKPRSSKDRVCIRDGMLLANVYGQLAKEAQQNGTSLDDLEQFALPPMATMSLFYQNRARQGGVEADKRLRCGKLY